MRVFTWRQQVAWFMLIAPLVSLVLFGIVMLIRTDPVGAGIIGGVVGYIGIAMYLLREREAKKEVR